MKSSRQLEEERILNSTLPYDILDIPPNASTEDIKKVYRKLSLKYHSDHNRDDVKKSDAIMQKLNYAYDVLTGKSQNIKYEESVSANPPKRSEYQPTEQSIKLDLKHRIESLETYLQFYLDNLPKGLFNKQSPVTLKLHALYEDMSDEISDSANSAFTRGTFSTIQSTTSFYQEIKTKLEDISKIENINEEHEHYKCLKHCMNFMDSNYHAESLDEKTKFVNNIPDRIVEFSNKILASKGLAKIDDDIFDSSKSSVDSNDNRLNTMYGPRDFSAQFKALPRGIQEMIEDNRSWKVNYASNVKGRVIFTFDVIENFVSNKMNEPKLFGFNLFSPHRSTDTDNFYKSMLDDMKKITAPKEEKRYSR